MFWFSFRRGFSSEKKTPNISIKLRYKDFSTIKKEHFEEKKLIKYLIIMPTLWDKILLP